MVARTLVPAPAAVRLVIICLTVPHLTMKRPPALPGRHDMATFEWAAAHNGSRATQPFPLIHSCQSPY